MAEKGDGSNEITDNDRTEVMGSNENIETRLAATEFIARFLRRDEEGRLVEDQPMLDMFLPMVLDMSVDTPLEHRLRVWQNMLEIDALQAAAYDGLIEGLVEKLHTHDPVLFGHLLEALDSEIKAKLQRLSNKLGASKEFTEETLDVGNYDANGLPHIIKKYYSHAQELYESIIVLLSCRQRITDIQVWEEIRADLEAKQVAKNKISTR